MLALAALPQAQQSTPVVDATGDRNDLPKLIRVQVEFIDVAHEQLTELMFGEHPSANDGELRKMVGGLVNQGKASILETMLCVAKDGQKATTESIEKFIYPTEFEPAQGPAENHTNASGEKIGSEQRNGAVGPSPSAWETRNLGSYLQIEPSLSDDQRMINLRFVPEIVYHVGDQVWAEWKDAHGRADIKVPLFYVMRTNTDITLAPRTFELAAVLTPKPTAPAPATLRKILVFVRADMVQQRKP